MCVVELATAGLLLCQNDGEASAVSYVSYQGSRQILSLRSETGVLSPWCIFCKKSRIKFSGAEVSLVNCELDYSYSKGSS